MSETKMQAGDKVKMKGGSQEMFVGRIIEAEFSHPEMAECHWENTLMNLHEKKIFPTTVLEKVP